MTAGSRLGPYEILSPLGAGGMGEVYRARDSKLGRSVAIKVLPPAYSSDHERLQRFEQEAQAASALNHPNIVTIHDVGRQDGTAYLAMELVDGKNVRELLETGPLPIKKALSIAAQVADGLAKAHAAGIVHRDLKPENVMVTGDGFVKVLDFGLAKLVPASGNGTGQTATAAVPATHPGILLGTISYMSPEQARGAAVDFRSDQFSLGTVLYEMLTGKRPFERESTAQTLTAIIEDEPPPLAELNPKVAAPVRWIIERCMAKEADERYASTRDLARDLQRVRDHLSDATSAATAVELPRGRSRNKLLLAAIAALLLAAGAFAVGGYWGRASSRAAPPIYRAVLNPPAGHSFVPYEVALSPDGRRLAFTATSADGVTTLWVKSLATNSDQEFAGTDDAAYPFWSPDGRQIGFFSKGKLNRLDITTGGVHTVCDALLGRGGTWSQEGIIVFAPRIGPYLMRVSANGGVPTDVTRAPGNSGESYRWPLFLPDGKHFLYTVDWSQTHDGLYVGSIEGSEGRLLAGDIRGNVEFSAGRLLFVRDGTLFAQPFDPARLTFTGEPAPIVVQELEQDMGFSRAGFSASASGALVYQSRQTYHSRLQWFDRSGKELEHVGAVSSYLPMLSRDGRMLSVILDVANNGHSRVHVLDLTRGTLTPITPESDRDETAVWSPDGSQIVYSTLNGPGQLLRKAADGLGQPEVLVQGGRFMANDWSRDGRYLAFMEFADGVAELGIYDFQEKKSFVFSRPGAEAQFSPDGHWMAFIVGGRSSAPQVFVSAFPGPGTRVAVSAGRGTQPRWRSDGKELYYIGDDKRLMAVSMATKGDAIQVGAARPLFQTRMHRARFALFQYDVADDGRRFLINSLPREDAAAPVTLLTNWTAEIAR